MTLSMKDLLSQAADAGYGAKLPDGRYTMRIKSTNSKANQGGNQQLGIQWEVVSGPATGSMWQNQTLTPSNAQALAIFFRVIDALGVPKEVVEQVNPADLAPLAGAILSYNQGITFEVDLVTSQREGKGKHAGKTFDNQDVRIKQRGGAPSGLVSQVLAPSPVTQVLTQPAVVVQAPQPVVLQPAPVVQPQPPVVVAAAEPAVVNVAPQPTIDPDQLAAFQAFQAQQAAAAAAQAAPAPQPTVDPATGLPPRPTGI